MTGQLLGGRPRGLDLAALPDGTAAVAWSSGEGNVAVSIRPPRGEFAPAETALEIGGSPLGITVAIDPATHQPVVGFTRVADDGTHQAAIVRRNPG
jgi:hypothetical protein